MASSERYDQHYQYEPLLDITDSFHELLRPRLHNHAKEKHKKVYLLGALQGFNNIIKDTMDTFKPYKGTYQLAHDLLQPVYGVGNLISGITTIVLSILLLLFLVIAISVLAIASLVALPFFGPMPLAFTMCLISGYKDEDILNNTSINFFIWLTEGITNLVRGITQIVFTPLTYLLKIPLRGMISLFHDRPLAEKNASLSNYIDEIDACVNQGSSSDFRYLLFLINKSHAKYQKSVARGQTTLLDPVAESKLAEPFLVESYRKNLTKQDSINYFQFFRPSKKNLSTTVSSDTKEHGNSNTCHA